MFDTSGHQPLEHEPLPHAATRCLHASSRADHTHAEALRQHSGGENHRCLKRRAVRLKRHSADREADAAALSQEARQGGRFASTRFQMPNGLELMVSTSPWGAFAYLRAAGRTVVAMGRSGAPVLRMEDDCLLFGDASVNLSVDIASRVCDWLRSNDAAVEDRR